MAMRPAAAQDLAQTLYPVWQKNRADIDRIDKWYRGKNDKPWMPRQSTQEYKDLQSRAINRFLKMVVRSYYEVLYVDGYAGSGEADNASAWTIWQANGMDAKQMAVHEGAMAHALSYVSVMPGVDFRGERMPVLRGLSSRSTFAWYQDDVDDWPMYVMVGKTGTLNGQTVWHLTLVDDEARYRFSAVDDRVTFIDLETHAAGICPVVRFANELDLEGRAEGVVEPNIPLASRIDQDIFDRLIVQRFGSWKVRTIAGMEIPETVKEDEVETYVATQKLRLKVEDMLVSESPDTRFGTLDESSIDGYVKAYETDIREMATVESVPPHQLLGQMANLSAEALAAAESSFSRKVEARKTMFGESWEQVLRVAAHIAGDEAGAADFEAEVRWRDMESRSLAQTADALGKLAQMLGVPPQALWERIPGVTQKDLERWKRLAEEADPFAALAGQLAGGVEPQPVE
jgi:hypothetical protein